MNNCYENEKKRKMNPWYLNELKNEIILSPKKLIELIFKRVFSFLSEEVIKLIVHLH